MQISISEVTFNRYNCNIIFITSSAKYMFLQLNTAYHILFFVNYLTPQRKKCDTFTITILNPVLFKYKYYQNLKSNTWDPYLIPTDITELPSKLLELCWQKVQMTEIIPRHTYTGVEYIPSKYTITSCRKYNTMYYRLSSILYRYNWVLVIYRGRFRMPRF